MTQHPNKSQTQRRSSPTPRMTSNSLEAFVAGLAEPEAGEREAMEVIGRQPGASGLDKDGKFFTVPGAVRVK